MRYDKNKPLFLKTDWSSLGMGFILMQPDDSPESIKSMKTLTEGNPKSVDFDKTLDGARLRPIRFGSRACTTAENTYIPFVAK